MKKYVPWIDFVLYGSISLLTVVVTLIAALTSQEWTYEKIIAISVVPTAIVCICLVILLTKIFTKPNYVTKHGCLVWSGSVGPSKEELEKFIDFYIEKLPILWPYVKEVDLVKMFDGAKLEFTDKLITIFGIGWTAVDKEGLQWLKNVKVKYITGKLERTALAHEFHHMADEVVFGIAPDYEHKNVLWWYTVSVLNAEYGYKR